MGSLEPLEFFSERSRSLLRSRDLDLDKRISNRRLGVFAFCWAAITTLTRVYLGYHYPSDILGGAALGILMVLLSQAVPWPPVVYRLLDWERCASPSFYAAAFIASYQAGTLFSDVRAIAHLIGQLL